jgi:hypothetical protein
MSIVYNTSKKRRAVELRFSKARADSDSVGAAF